MEARIYADNFSQQFNTEGTFLEFLKDSDSRAIWKTIRTKALRFKALEEGSYSTEKLIEDYREQGKEGVISDTFANTSLVLESDGKCYPVRTCAIKTILERAQISGRALTKVPKKVLARMLNDCMNVGQGNALVKYLDDKISAVHGGDETDYAILELAELFRMTAEFLRENFPGTEYKGGTFDHSLVSAIWELKNNDALVQAYHDSLERHGIASETVTPSVRLASSDVGISGANLYPQLLTGAGRIIPLGSPLKLEHKHGATLSDFEKKLNMLYSQYQNALKKLTGLLDIYIHNPVNTMIGVMKKIGIPKGLGMEAVELFKVQYGTAPCSAHDIYYGIAEVINMVQASGKADKKTTLGVKVMQMEENVMRALNVHWREYDIPGDIRW